MPRSVLKLSSMKSIILIFLGVGLIGCAAPKDDKSFVAEKSPAAAVLAGEQDPDVKLAEKIREANERNQRRLKEGDWRAIQPAVGPKL